MRNASVWGCPARSSDGPVVITRGSDYQRVSLPVSNRVAHPGRIGIFRQRAAVGKNLAKNGVIFVKDDDEIRRLNDFHREGANPDAGFRTWREASDAVRVPAKIILALFVQGRGPRPHLLRLEVRSA